MKDDEEKTEAATADGVLPKWFADGLAAPFRAGIAHEFIVHGDVTGLVANPDVAEEPAEPYISLRKFLEKVWDERAMVIFYNIASGLQFPTPEMERKFKQAAGLEEKAEAGSDAVAAAMAGLQAKRGLPREPEACLPLIEKVMKKVDQVAVAIQSAHFVAVGGGPGNTLTPVERINIERLKNWAQDDDLRERRSMIVLLTDQAAKVSAELRQSGNGLAQVFIPKPDKAERIAFVQSLIGAGDALVAVKVKIKDLQARQKKAKKAAELKAIAEELAVAEEELAAQKASFEVPKDFDVEVFAHATQGLSLRQILDIFLRCRDAGSGLDLSFVKQEKRRILNEEFGDILEVVEPSRGLEDIGGHDHIKEYVRRVIDAVKRGEYRLVPMGVTLAGPPGTGKTAIVEAAAKEAGYNFVKMRNLRSMWVGESERNSERLEYALRSLAPVFVMNDEADLGDAQRDAPRGDSGVSERLMKKWMELLSDPRIRGQIIVINCTNRPDRLDAALRRTGRSDDIILMPMPRDDEYDPIFRVMFKRHAIPTDIKDFQPFLTAVRGLSGADIEKVVLNAFRFADEAGRKAVDAAALQAAVRDFIPSASQADIDLMTLMGLRECRSRQLLPKNVKALVKGIVDRGLVTNLEEIVADLKARRILSAETSGN